MSVNFICELCNDHLFGGEAFYGNRDGAPVISCFDCYLAELKSFTVNDQLIRTNILSRDIEADDLLVFYDRDGRVLSKLAMRKISGDQLIRAKEGVATETGIAAEYITLVIEAHDHDVKQGS